MELLCLRFNVLFIMDALVNFTSGKKIFFQPMFDTPFVLNWYAVK